MADIHPAAGTGFGANAALYVRGRPDYPLEVAGWLTDVLGLGAGTSVLDLGAGTGKFTPYLLETGARVLAVEPVASMRAQIGKLLPPEDVLAGTAEEIPLPDAAVDVVVCAQAFHWFATSAALDEILRVLKPGGSLGLIWNRRDKNTPWVRALDDIFETYAADTPRYHTGAWRRVFPHSGFGPWSETTFDHAHSGSTEDVIINRVLSVSFIGALEQQERSKVEARVRALIDSESDLRDREVVTMPYQTIAFSMAKGSP